MQTKTEKTLTCPWWFLFTFDNPLRKMFQDPHQILSRYIKQGDTVLDVGCGMGYFTIELARLVGENGKVIAADLQPQMLDGLAKRAEKAGVTSRIQQVQSTHGKIGINEQFDMINVFWMAHEVRRKQEFFQELFDHLKPGGKLLWCEPKGHVPLREFNRTYGICFEIGFLELDFPQIAFSRTIVFTK